MLSLEALKQYGADAVSFQALKVGARWWTDAPPPRRLRRGHRLRPVRPFVDRDRQSARRRRGPRGRRAAVLRRRARATTAGRVLRRRGPRVARRLQDRDDRTPVRVEAVGVGPHAAPVAEAARAVAARAGEGRDGAGRRSGRAGRGHAAARGGRAFERGVAGVRVPMEPMGFLVEVKPFHAAGEHLYFVAERARRSGAVPVGGADLRP